MKHGLFISAEGTDGSGKTTQIGYMTEYLRAAGHDVVLLREPGGTRISEVVRGVILDPANTEMADCTEMFLYAAARAQLVAETIKPALLEGKVVICDRYVDSTYAYQGYGRGLDLDMLRKVNEIAICGTMPDVTFFFDIDPEVAISRRMAAGKPDRIENEKLEFHRRVHSGYLQLSARESQRIKIIDSNRSVGEIWDDVKKVLDTFTID